MLKEFGGVAQLDGGDLGNLGALFARSTKDTPADIQARRQHLAIAAFDKQAGAFMELWRCAWPTRSPAAPWSGLC